MISLAIPTAGPQAQAVVSINVTPPPWHNRLEPCDVDGDNAVAPNDALSVINFINTHGRGPISKGLYDGSYYDVNDDDHVTPIDALTVINYLNAAELGEGEGPDRPFGLGAAFENRADFEPRQAEVDQLLAADLDWHAGARRARRR